MRLAISVEGQTEEEFVKTVLAEHLRPFDVKPEPILIGSGRGSGGGNVTVERLTFDMALLYRSHDAVTSLVDFYGFQSKGDRTVEELETYLHGKVGEKIGSGWDETKLFPYVQRHEFEGLLFSDVGIFANQIDFPNKSVGTLQTVRGQFETPEDINDNPDTAPSKRIAGAIPRYNKRLHGPRLAKEMGLDIIRAECPRFNAWMTRLESLNPETDVRGEPLNS